MNKNHEIRVMVPYFSDISILPDCVAHKIRQTIKSIF